ncbi:hypothetical protein OVY01_07370 [Robbsia sp. Bb-Pol-6]|uniref:Uncharacterized protein n=1 Tax=Robbsia betulipollinis TaxID=2981849 RepID=A0ABT3ZKJ6_9BURK|nr:hypothetical protein [Robbsia betulipollinis]MCY0387055.1 hypothetical protein [Robbsia betulipollinis]
MTMFNAIADITPQMQATLDQIITLAASNPHDPRVREGIDELNRVAAGIAQASAATPEAHVRSAGKVVADGLLAAAAICQRLQAEKVSS